MNTPIIILDTKTLTPRTHMPTGLVGQISLARLIRQLATAGEFQKGERVTHVAIFSDGTIQFRLEEQET